MMPFTAAPAGARRTRGTGSPGPARSPRGRPATLRRRGGDVAVAEEGDDVLRDDVPGHARGPAGAGGRPRAERRQGDVELRAEEVRRVAPTRADEADGRPRRGRGRGRRRVARHVVGRVGRGRLLLVLVLLLRVRVRVRVRVLAVRRRRRRRRRGGRGSRTARAGGRRVRTRRSPRARAGASRAAGPGAGPRAAAARSRPRRAPRGGRRA